MSKPDFSHLHKLSARADKVVPYELFELEGAPTLNVKCAQDNKGYLNRIRARRSDIEKKVRKIQSKQKKSRRLRPVDIINELMRPVDVECFPIAIIDGWDENIVDTKGKTVDFSEENCTEFLRVLPNHIFDALRLFVADPNNFLEIDDVVADDDEKADIAGNL